MAAFVLGEGERTGGGPGGGGGRLSSRVTEKLQNQIHVSFAEDYGYKRLRSFRATPRKYPSESFLGVKEHLEVSPAKALC